MADKVRISDPFGILGEFNPDAPQVVEARPDIAGTMSRLTDRIARATYLEPFFFHPDQTVQAQAATACVPVDVGKLGDYLVHVLATATNPQTLAAAAAAVWNRDDAGTGGVAATVDSLRAYSHALGRPKVRQIVELLMSQAPDAAARARFTEEATENGPNLIQL